MSSLHWMPLYIPDYLADTGHLSAEEHGAYLLLIMHYWMQNGLPDDDERLARIAKIPAERWPSVRAVIRPFFGEGWYHARVEEERAGAEKKYLDRSEAGRKGGFAKAAGKSGSKNVAEPVANDLAKSKQSPSNHNHNHNHHTSPFQERGDDSPTRTHARARETRPTAMPMQRRMQVPDGWRCSRPGTRTVAGRPAGSWNFGRSAHRQAWAVPYLRREGSLPVRRQARQRNMVL